MDKKTIQLFVSKSSSSFSVTLQEFKKLIKALESVQPFEYKVIDIEEQPEIAEKYKIDAVPTILIGSVRFIGKPNAEKLKEIATQISEDEHFLADYTS